MPGLPHMISVLYVDDEQGLLELAKIFLEDSGEFRVETSISARKVLDSPKIPSYDAIVSDYQMPEMDGIAFLKIVRERFGNIPFILFTGRGREEVVIEALNNGADFYLQKGGEPTAQFAELSNKIRYAVARKQAETELQRKNDELNASYEQIAANEEELRQQLDELSEKQDALKHSEEKFRAFTENIPDLTTIVDMTGVYTYVSPSIQRITGWRAENLLGKTFAGIDSIFGIPPEDKEILLKSGRIAIQTPGEAIPVPPLRVRDSNGETRFIEGTNTYLPGVEGIQGILFHGRDISDRIRAEEELKRKNEELNASYEEITASDEELRGQYEELAYSEKRIRENELKFRSLFEKTHDALVLFTDEGCIDCNQRALDLFGYASREEFLGLKPMDVSPPVQPDGQDSGASTAARLSTLFNRGTDNFEWLQRRRDGSTFLADILLSGFELGGKQVFLSSVRDVTERRLMEDQLQLLKISVDRSSDEVIWMDFDGSIIYVNDAACRTTGYSRDELLTMKLFELDPDFSPDLWEASVADLRLQKTRFITTRHRCKNGAIIDVEIAAVYVTKDNREYSFAFVRDITRRKQVETELRERGEQYKRIFESFVDTYYETDKNGIVRVASPSLFTLSGWKPEELVGTSILTLYDNPSDRQVLIERLKQNPEVSGFETTLRKRDGTTASVSVNARVRYGPHGEPDGIAGSIRDITEKVRVRKALEAREKEYRHILENLQDAYIRTDRRGHVTMVNPSAARMYGYSSPEEMTGIPTDSLYATQDQRETMLQKMQEGGRVTDSTGEARRKDGTMFWASINIQNIFDDTGGIAGTEAIVRDITERKTMEQAIREANKKLSLLSSITCHDVANQLTMLQGYVQLTEIKNTDPVVADFLSRIEQSADAITHHIEFTKAYHELGVQLPGWVRLDSLISSAGGPEIKMSNACTNTEIFSDPMIERVFFNLCNNAVQHGGHVTEIAVRCEHASDRLVIIVEDNGVGIAPEEKEKIFEKGYGKNTGFGLFLAREILSITGITIRETGEPGNGARFEITVPKGMWRLAGEKEGGHR